MISSTLNRAITLAVVALSPRIPGGEAWTEKKFQNRPAAGTSRHAFRTPQPQPQPENSSNAIPKKDDPKWEGSSYSWTPPPRQKRRDRRKITVGLAHCGEIEIEQRPSQMDSSRTGVTLWAAAYSIADYIDEQCATKSWNPNRHSLTCLELGAGLGLPSIVAAKHGFDCWATESDEAVLPLLETNIEQNLREREQVNVQSFNWTDDLSLHPDLVRFEPDLIVASDLIYKDTKPAWGALVYLLSRLRASRQQRQRKREENNNKEPYSITRFDGTRTPPSDPLVLLGYTHRSRNLAVEEEREFFKLLRRTGIDAYPIPHDLVPNSDQRVLTTLFELRYID